MIILISLRPTRLRFCMFILLMYGIVPSGFRSSPLSFLGNIWFSIALGIRSYHLFNSFLNTWHCSPHPSIPYPHPQHQLSPAFVYGRLRWTQRTRLYAANSSSSILLLSSLLLSRFIPAPFMLACWGGPVWHDTMFEYGGTHMAEGSP
jgi:hypothetical protein